MDRIFFMVGAIMAFIAVAAGAFGAHGLKGRISPEMLVIFETGVRYHMYHALSLFAVAWAYSRWPSTTVAWGGWLILAGTIIFSGSLYILSFTGIRWLGAITPFGGLSLLIGWLCLAWAMVKK